MNWITLRRYKDPGLCPFHRDSLYILHTPVQFLSNINFEFSLDQHQYCSSLLLSWILVNYGTDPSEISPATTSLTHTSRRTTFRTNCQTANHQLSTKEKFSNQHLIQKSLNQRNQSSIHQLSSELTLQTGVIVNRLWRPARKSIVNRHWRPGFHPWWFPSSPAEL